MVYFRPKHRPLPRPVVEEFPFHFRRESSFGKQIRLPEVYLPSTSASPQCPHGEGVGAEPPQALKKILWQAQRGETTTWSNNLGGTNGAPTHHTADVGQNGWAPAVNRQEISLQPSLPRGDHCRGGMGPLPRSWCQQQSQVDKTRGTASQVGQGVGPTAPKVFNSDAFDVGEGKDTEESRFGPRGSHPAPMVIQCPRPSHAQSFTLRCLPPPRVTHWDFPGGVRLPNAGPGPTLDSRR